MAKTGKKHFGESRTVRARTARVALDFDFAQINKDFVVVESVREYPKDYDYSRYRSFTAAWDDMARKYGIVDACVGNLRRNKKKKDEGTVEHLFILFREGGDMYRMLGEEGYKKAGHLALPDSEDPNDPRETVAVNVEAMDPGDLAELLLCALPRVVSGIVSCDDGERLTNAGGKLLSLNTEGDTSCTAFEANIEKVNYDDKSDDKEHAHRLKLNLATYRTVEDVQGELDSCNGNGNGHEKKRRRLERALRGPRYVKSPRFLSRGNGKGEDAERTEYVKCGIDGEKAHAPLVACSSIGALRESKHFHYDEILRLARKYLGRYMTIRFLELDVQRMDRVGARTRTQSWNKMMSGLEIFFVDAFDREFLRRSDDRDDAENAGKRYEETVSNFERYLGNVVNAIETLVGRDVVRVSSGDSVPEETTGNPSLVVRLVGSEGTYRYRRVEDEYLRDCAGAVVQHISAGTVWKAGKKNAAPVAKNILKELLVKRDVANGVITVDRWSDYGVDKDICFGVLREREKKEDENEKKTRKEYNGYHYVRISPDGRCRYGTVETIPGGVGGNRERVECFFWYPEEPPESDTDMYSLTEQNAEKICVVENTGEHYLPLMEAQEVEKIIKKSADRGELKTSDGNIVDTWSACERWVRGIVRELPDSEAKKLLETACDRYAKNARIELATLPESVDSERLKKLEKETKFSTRNLYKWMKRMNVPSTAEPGETSFEETMRLLSIPPGKGRGKVLDEAKKELEKRCDVEFVHSKDEIALETSFGGLLNTTYRTETGPSGDVELYYAVGRANEDINGTEHKVDQTSLIRRITAGSESGMNEGELVEKILPMLHVGVVRLNMATAVPYPVKLLREYVLALNAEERRLNKSITQ